MSNKPYLRLQNAQRNGRVDNEYYTLLEDISTALLYVKDQLHGLNVYCNCDTAESNIVRALDISRNETKIRSLTYSAFAKGSATTFAHYLRFGLGGKLFTIHADNLQQDNAGDYLSTDCVNLLKEADCVITNPPFYRIRRLVNLIESNRKKFLILAQLSVLKTVDNIPAVDVLPCVVRKFLRPNGNIERFNGYCIWLTNFEVHKPRFEFNGNGSGYRLNNGVLCFDKMCDVPAQIKEPFGVPLSCFRYLNKERYNVLKCEKQPIKEDGTRIFSRLIIQSK